MAIEELVYAGGYLGLLLGGLYLANKVISNRFGRKGGEKSIYTETDIRRIRGVYEEQLDYLNTEFKALRQRSNMRERPSQAIAASARSLGAQPSEGSVKDFANQLWDELVPPKWKMALAPVRDGVIGGIEDRVKKEPDLIARLISRFVAPAQLEEGAQTVSPEAL